MSRKDLVASVVIILAALIVVMALSGPTIHTRIVSDATLSAYGEFDRIELCDRHTDWLTGVEVEGIQLASLNESGTVSIERHRTGSYTKNYTFHFFLYVYADTNHTRERISVVGGDVSEYEYSNVVITVSLTTAEEVIVLSNPEGAVLIGFGFAGLLCIFYYMYKTW